MSLSSVNSMDIDSPDWIRLDSPDRLASPGSKTPPMLRVSPQRYAPLTRQWEGTVAHLDGQMYNIAPTPGYADLHQNQARTYIADRHRDISRPQSGYNFRHAVALPTDTAEEIFSRFRPVQGPLPESGPRPILVPVGEIHPERDPDVYYSPGYHNFETARFLLNSRPYAQRTASFLLTERDPEDSEYGVYGEDGRLDDERISRFADGMIGARRYADDGMPDPVTETEKWAHWMGDGERRDIHRRHIVEAVHSQFPSTAAGLRRGSISRPQKRR